jgi:hypothetical protein
VEFSEPLVDNAEAFVGSESQFTLFGLLE